MMDAMYFMMFLSVGKSIDVTITTTIDIIETQIILEVLSLQYFGCFWFVAVAVVFSLLKKCIQWFRTIFIFLKIHIGGWFGFKKIRKQMKGSNSSSHDMNPPQPQQEMEYSIQEDLPKYFLLLFFEFCLR